MAIHTKSTHHFGDLLDTYIIGYTPYNISGFALQARNLHFLDYVINDQRWPVDATHR